jgi:hypothetical protein
MLTTVRDWYGLEVVPCVRNTKCVVKCAGIITGSSVNGIHTKDVLCVDTEQALTSSNVKKRTSKSRPIKSKENKYWCDAYKCDECPVRFQCFTSRGEIETEKEIDRWKLYE